MADCLVHMKWNMRRDVAFVIFGFVATIALAGDDDPVKRPYVEPGDCWTYRAENMNYQGPIGDYELCVTLVDAAKDLIFAVAKVKGDEREIDQTYSLDWATYTSILGNVFPQGVKMFRFPLRVGDTWSFETEFSRRDSRQTVQGKAKWDMKIVGWEDIAVPAGRFRALRVEGKGKIERSAWDFNWSSMVYWYAPKVSRHVKFWVENPQNPQSRVGEELTGYRLNQ